MRSTNFNHSFSLLINQQWQGRADHSDEIQFKIIKNNFIFHCSMVFTIYFFVCFAFRVSHSTTATVYNVRMDRMVSQPQQ